MDAREIALVRAGFEALAPLAGEIVDVFYKRLFLNYPGVRPLFPQDMTGQKAHLAAAIALVGKNAERMETLQAPLMKLGAAHVKYGARPEHYPIVRDVLLDALEEVGGAAFDEEMRGAWFAALNVVAGYMLRGAVDAEREAPLAAGVAG